MLEVLTRPPRLDLAAALLVIGLGLIARGMWSLPRRGDPRRSWPEWAFRYLYVFRRLVVGSCIVGAGAGLAENIGWLVAASVCIGLGELLESSYYIGVLRWGQAHGAPVIEAAPELRSTRESASCARLR